MPDTSEVLDLKAFVPAKDFERSKQFYRDLGFRVLWSNDEVAEIEAGAFRFLLQNYYVEAFASSFMMQLMVKDAGAWWKQIQDANIVEKYPGIMAKPPKVQPWGLRVLYLSDPAGVLWHIADRPAAGG